MNEAWSFLSKVILILIGTGVFGYLNYLRVRRDAIRKNSIEFLEEVSSILNKPLSMFFGNIRSQQDELDKTVLDALAEVAYFRLSVSVKSNAFLGNPSFAKFYFSVGNELKELMLAFKRLKKEEVTEISEHARRQYTEFSKRFDGELATNGEGLPAPYDEILKWNSTIFRTVRKRLIQEVKSATR